MYHEKESRIMETTESCKYCEKFELHIETKQPISGPLDLPNTFYPKTNKYVWKHTDMMAYAIIPKSVKGTVASVDLFLCIDEDILDDIDVNGYANKFLREEIIPKWNNLKDIHVSEPLLGCPDNLPCWKVQHKPMVVGATPTMQE